MRPRSPTALLACTTFAFSTPVATMSAQSEPLPTLRGSIASLGGAFMTATGGTGPTGGLMARLGSLSPRRPQFDAGLGYFAPSRTDPVFGRYSAAFAEVGASYAVPRGASTVLLRTGGSFLLNANGDGDLAPYVGVGVLHPVSSRFGVRFDLSGRYWLEGPGPGLGTEASIVWFMASRDNSPATPSSPAPPANRTVARLDGWSFGGSANLIGTELADLDRLFGPSLQVTRLAPGRLGFEGAITYVTPTGFYDFSGLALDLGFAYAVPVGTRPLLLLESGLTLLAGGDSDGGGGAAAALAPGTGLVVPVAGRLGIRLGISPRLWLTEHRGITFGASAGILLLPH